jgi:predicted glycosyltransferase
MMKKVLFYCQHVLGMGHLIRSLTLVEGLAREFSVCFLNGGELVAGLNLPSNVTVINLPPLKSDENFSGLTSTDGAELVAIQQARRQQILATYADFQPDVVVIELFPFGRKKFAFELMPLLTRIRLAGGKTKVVCSLRDILVSRPQQGRYEARVCDVINRYFDLILVHADPRFQTLAESFGSLHQIRTPIRYTGYVAQEESVEPASPEEVTLDALPRPLLLASIGGGRVGYELLAGCVAASQTLATRRPHHLLIFTGPYLPAAEFAQLQAAVAGQPQITLRRFTNRFLHYMAQADLSISMAGYNTCMNLLSTQTRALVLPFTGAENDEQTIRAEKLAQLGALEVLTPTDLTGARLAERMETQLTSKLTSARLDLGGVNNSCCALHALLHHPTASRPPAPLAPNAAESAIGQTEITQILRPYLAGRETVGPPVAIFLRDDDIDVEEETLRQLLDICIANAVPINLEIIPATLTEATTQLLRQTKDAHPELIELDQHGWQHANHEQTGRKCEFGPSRTYAEQYADIARGKALLEAALKQRFSPVFTPPWNRCTPDTLRVLHELGFQIFSRDRHPEAITEYGFQEVSTTLDLYSWKTGAQMKEPVDLIHALISQLESGESIGLLLHHKVMDAAAFAFLDNLLRELTSYSFVHFYTLQGLVAATPATESNRSASLPTPELA